MSRFRVGSRFALRIPLLPYDVVDAGSGDLSNQRAHLSAILDRPEVSEAIVLASGSLHRSIDTWRSAPNNEAGYRTEVTLAKYVSRMASAPIPFGAFAGVTTGEVDRHLGEQPSFLVGAVGVHGRRTRLHGEILHWLMTVLSQVPAVRRRSVFRTNTSAWITSGRLSYFQANHPSGRPMTVEYAWMSVELTPHLAAILEEARTGARLDVLASAVLRHDPEVTPAEAEAYVEALVDAQIVVPQMGVSATGVEPMEVASRQLADAGLDDLARLFERIREELAVIDERGVGRPTESYSTVVELLGQLWRRTHALAMVDVPARLDGRRLFHLDVQMGMTERPVLGADVIRDIERTVSLLEQIGPGPTECARSSSARRSWQPWLTMALEGGRLAGPTRSRSRFAWGCAAGNVSSGSSA